MGSGAQPNFTSGYGFIQASGAMALIPPGAPTVSASASTLVVNNSATITWSSVNAASCTASGAWSGALAPSGSKTVQPAAAGTLTYTLTCSNSAGASAPASVSIVVSLPVADPPPTSSGGGSLDGPALLGLAGVAGLAAVKRRRRLAICSGP
jgi:MYXO-CTERM domain-containing protein